MKNITLALEDEIVEAGREYAERHGTSLNALVRDLLRKTVRPKSTEWIEEQFRLMDEMKADSKGKRWKRSDLYDV